MRRFWRYRHVRLTLIGRRQASALLKWSQCNEGCSELAMRHDDEKKNPVSITASSLARADMMFEAFHLSIYLSVCLCINLSIYRSIDLSIYINFPGKSSKRVYKQYIPVTFLIHLTISLWNRGERRLNIFTEPRSGEVSISKATIRRLIPGLGRKDWILRALLLAVKSLRPHKVASLGMRSIRQDRNWYWFLTRPKT